VIKVKPHNKTTDLILKAKEGIGSLYRITVAKAFKRTCQELRPFTADGYLIKSIDSQSVRLQF
jgi:hypothetical protein